jgi:hypothetical protein
VHEGGSDTARQGWRLAVRAGGRKVEIGAKGGEEVEDALRIGAEMTPMVIRLSEGVRLSVRHLDRVAGEGLAGSVERVGHRGNGVEAEDVVNVRTAECNALTKEEARDLVPPAREELLNPGVVRVAFDALALPGYLGMVGREVVRKVEGEPSGRRQS